MTRILAAGVLAVSCWFALGSAKEPPLRLATFQLDATPPLGSPLCYGAVAPAREIVDSLTARGVIFSGHGAPIVLCAVDWVGIGNGGHDAWRRALAEAAGTSVQRVSVHAVHQHDAPGCDFTAEELLARGGMGGAAFDADFARDTIKQTAAAVRRAIDQLQPITHLGIGKAKVEKVASNRRILGPDGKVKHMRYSSCKDEAVRAEPEGTIDPYVRLLSFWQDEEPIAVLSYYATHPQSYYGQGGVNADFVGMARSMREAALPGVAHIHFNGAGGNVAAGKYNDGSPEKRPILAKRLAEGMAAAWKNTQKAPINGRDVAWRNREVLLPLAEHLQDRSALQKILDDSGASVRARNGAALDLAWVGRVRSRHRINLTCLRLGTAFVMHMPGELFVEYQIAAEQMRPDATVCMAAYADYGPGYIGTAIAYTQGGYETGPASRVAPEVEDVLMTAMGKLLE